MKRYFLNLLLASGMLAGAGISVVWLNTATAQTKDNELFYTYYDQKNSFTSASRCDRGAI